MRHILLLASIFYITSAYAQQRSAAYGGNYIPDHTECLSEPRRAEIHRMLDANKTMLRAKGLLNEEAQRKATAVSYNWPIHQYAGNYYNVYGISNFVDHDPTYPDNLLDWNCGQRTYDLASGYNHAGMDIFLWPFAWNMMEAEQVEIIAAAAGTIIGKEDGHPDHHCGFNDTGDWNAVYIQHSDGSVAWYGHMKTGTTINKNVGEAVIQGEHLGFVGSSGMSTAPHLHFEVYDPSNNLADPYSGPCQLSPSLWSNQKPYYDPGVNTLMTHFAPPGFSACPLVDTINSRDTFAPGSLIYFITYYHDQLDTTMSTYTILRPDNSIYVTWPHNSGVPHYAASFWYWSYTVSATEPTGHWKFKVHFNNADYVHDFYILDPTAGIENIATKHFSVYPNPAYDHIAITGSGANTIEKAELINMLGQTVLTGTDASNNISLSSINNGIYILRLSYKGGTELHRITVGK